jgi:phosphatidylserine/phosphatidylglycerophosphate/cardiolipin synthase-like enzyme
MNFSNSGENKNDENLIIIENKEIAKLYKNFFLYQWNKIDDKYLEIDIRAEGPESIGSCFDGLDNNYDGFIDSEDEACKK